jgi:YbbR domain-containing protein
MKNLILNNWQAKLACLILATAFWYLVKSTVATSPQSRVWPAITTPSE